MITNIDTHKQSVLEDMPLGYISYSKCFSLSDAGINQKIFSVWKTKGLVAFLEKGKWTRLSFQGLIWLRVLESMRQFGCSVKLMKKVYSYYFTRALEDKLFEKSILEQIEYLKADKSEEELKTIKPSINSLEVLLRPEFRAELENEYSYFSFLVMKCLGYKTQSGLIIFEDETFSEYIINDANKVNENKLLLADRPKLIIPISYYITELLTDENKMEFLGPSGLLNEDELRILKEIRNKNAKSITISFREKDHRLEKIESDTQGIIKGDQAKKIMAILGLKNYEGIELKTRDGKTLSFTHTDKTFL